MLFFQNSLAFQIYDVLYLQQGYSKSRNKNRHYDALSFRIHADTVIEDSQNRVHLTNGSIAYFPSNYEYIRIAQSDTLIVVHFKCFNFSGNGIEHFTPNDPQIYEESFRELLSCWNKKEPGYQYRSAAIFCQILSMIHCDHIPLTPPHSKIEPSVAYIQENLLKKDFSLTEAAKKSYVSDVYFRKLFKSSFGMSPKQYVIHNRIQHATSLILSGYYNLQEVAEQCGYGDYKHFTTEFKRIMGVSPSQYEYDCDKRTTGSSPL